MPDVTLSPAAKQLLGTPCPPGSCEEAQLAAGVCPPDPNLTCQLPMRLPSAGGPPPRTKVVRRSTYVANARKGNLFLCPADGTGPIGGLLLQLAFPQQYSHMGVFVDEGFTIRHSTVSQKQILSEKHRVGSILGKKAPTEGFDPDAVRYGWPGTITQTVDDAFHQWPGSVTYRDADNDDYDIAELSFSDVESTSGEVLSAIVVRPCHESTELRDVLSVVTEAVKAINGHYRFYAYTDATVALDPDRAGPPLSVRKLEGGVWVEQNGELVDPSNPCSTARSAVTSTLPVVCSTLPWVAVQLVNEGVFRGRSSRDWGRRYSLELDTNTSERDRCQQHVVGNPLAHVVPPGTPDGLVMFDEAQRADAAAWFYETIVRITGEEAANELPAWLEDAGHAGIGVGLLLAVFAPGVGAVAGALLVTAGIAASDADQLILAVTDMQEHVANQFCNAFANDDAHDATSASLWRRPGEGRSVGPDDTAWFWSAPQGFDPVLSGRVHGLYGSNVQAALRRWEWVEEIECVWKESAGEAEISGIVQRDTGKGLEPVVGAVVEFACRAFTTDRRGRFSGLAPEGIYLLDASFTDPVSGYVWEAVRNGVDIQIPGPAVNVVLLPPPAEFRKVDIIGTIDIVDRVAIGHDGWAHSRPSDTAFLGPYSRLNPDPSQRNEGLSWRRTLSAGPAGGESSCEIDLALIWNPDLSVEVALAARLKDGNDVDDTHDEVRTVQEDASEAFVFEMSSGESWPDRAWVKLTFNNARQG